MSDEEMKHLEIAKSYVKLVNACGETMYGCKGCCFACGSDTDNFTYCAIGEPFKWSINYVKEWIKEHESEETK